MAARTRKTQQKLIEKYRNNVLFAPVIKADEKFFDQFLDYSSYPFRKGPLTRKMKELILIAMDATPTHLYEPGLRMHIRDALKHGATREEILEVLQLASLVGIHSCTFGIPILDDEMKNPSNARKGSQSRSASRSQKDSGSSNQF